MTDPVPPAGEHVARHVLVADAQTGTALAGAVVAELQGLALAGWSKELLHVAAGFLALLAAALTDGRLDGLELLDLTIYVAGTCLLPFLPNQRDGLWHYTKLVVAAGVAGLQTLANFVALGVPVLNVSTGDWAAVIVAAIAAAGVGVIPNAPRKVVTP